MTASNNGGPAFPATEEHGLNTSNFGMTLRDYFAANAPVTLADAEKAYRLNYGDTTFTVGDILDYLADLRWAYADSMLEGRDK